MKYITSLILMLFPFQEAIGGVEVLGVTFNSYFGGSLVLFFFGLISALFGKCQKLRIDATDICLLVVVIIASLNLAFNFSMPSAFLFYRGLFIPFVFYFSIKHFLLEQEVNFVLNAYIVSAVVFSVLCVFEFVSTGGQRVNSIMITPINAALVIFPALCFCRITGLKLILKTSCMVLLFMALLMTLSRAYIATALPLFLFYGIYKKFNKKLILISFFAISIVVTFYSVGMDTRFIENNIDILEGSEKQERLFDINLYKMALVNRGVAWKYGLDVFYDNLVFGHGYHQAFGHKVGYHNLIVDWLAYSGITGLALLYLALHFSLSPRGSTTENFHLFSFLLFAAVINGFANGMSHGIMPWSLFFPLALMHKTGESYEI